LLKALAPDRFLLVSSTAGRLKQDWEEERNRQYAHQFHSFTVRVGVTPTTHSFHIGTQDSTWII
jgi:hypothetical protein